MTVNGSPIELDIPESRFLAEVLRYDLGLTGTKIGCNEAECGICTVLVDGQPVDSCIFPAFTAEASGHNPRSSGGQRMRQRVMHKLRYAFESFEEIFCVGCGRCVCSCPVNVDIRETIAEVMQ